MGDACNIGILSYGVCYDTPLTTGKSLLRDRTEFGRASLNKSQSLPNASRLAMSARDSEKFTIALRILMAVSTQAKPADADSLLLYLHCPGYDNLEPDELASVVIRDALNARMTVGARLRDHISATDPHLSATSPQRRRSSRCTPDRTLKNRF